MCELYMDTVLEINVIKIAMFFQNIRLFGSWPKSPWDMVLLAN